MVGTPAPLVAKCGWYRRTSSKLAVSGDRTSGYRIA
jgi:hypothetical protein